MNLEPTDGEDPNAAPPFSPYDGQRLALYCLALVAAVLIAIVVLLIVLAINRNVKKIIAFMQRSRPMVSPQAAV
jgi:hypothetical protein